MTLMEHSTARFTSTKCPPGQGLENSCELPFGFVWTPLAPPSEDTQVVVRPNSPPPPSAAAATVEEEEEGQGHDNKEDAPAALSPHLPPILCLTCLSYLNLYAAVDKEAGVWTCPLCETRNALPKQVLQGEDPDLLLAPLLASNSVELRQRIVGKPVVGSNSNASIMVDATTVVLVLDAHLPAADAHAIGTMMEHVLLQHYQSDPKEKVQRLIHLGLIIFGKNVSLYQLGVSGMAVADVFCSHRGLTDDYLQTKSYLGTVRSAETLQTDLQGLWRCLAAHYGPPPPPSEATLENDENALLDPTILMGSPSSANKSSSRMEMLKQRKEARLRKQQQQQQQQQNGSTPTTSTTTMTTPKSPWTTAVDEAPWTQRLRCTGEAVQCAIDLSSMVTTIQPQPRTARVFVFTNGCPSQGPGRAVRVDPESATAAAAAAAHHHPSAHIHHQAPYKVDSHELARAKEYFDVLAKTAAEGGIGFDVLCTGSAELGLPAYQALVEPSSGYVLLQESFGKQPAHLQHNMNHLLNQTFMTGIYAEPPPPPVPVPANATTNTTETTTGAAAAANTTTTTGTETTTGKDQPPPPLEMNWIDGCIVDLRMAGFVEPTHLVGTGEFFESEHSHLLANERSAFAQGRQLAKQAGISTRNLPVEEMVAGSLTRVRLGRYDSLSTFSVMLQLHDLLPEDEFAIFQCIARHVDSTGQELVTRISTHRLAIAKDVSEFLDAVDEEVVPVLLGKEAVYRSMYGREVDGVTTDATDQAQLEKLAYDAQQDIDTTIQNISGAFRLVGLEEGMSRAMDLTTDGKHRALGSSMDFAFPAELSGALRRLYHLRRGPLISPGPLQSMDDRAELRSLFVRLPLQQCLSMMAPSLWSSGPLDPNKNINDADDDAVQVRLSETVPPETLALWRNSVVAADFYQSLFVWSGQETRDASYDKIRHEFQQLLLDQCKDRFPMPTFHLVSEGDSMSRRFTSLLSPSHADPVQHQVAHFPALEKLDEEELTHLRSKFPFHDSNVDPSFRQWFWDVASAASKGQGVSLCE